MIKIARPWRWLGIVVAVGAVVTGVWLHYPAAPPPQTPDSVTHDASTDDPAAAASAADNQQRAKLEELRTMSETFRNTTFLIAIRDAGYLCIELVNVYGGVGDSTTWTVACREMLAYAVSVSSAGALHVEPAVHHLDAPFPTRDELPSPPPR